MGKFHYIIRRSKSIRACLKTQDNNNYSYRYHPSVVTVFYTLLEDYLGCKWFLQGEPHTKAKIIELPVISVDKARI